MQQVGSTIQEDLLSILIRFLMYRIVLSVDIEKMFQQILVTPQRPLQRIIMEGNPSRTHRNVRTKYNDIKYSDHVGLLFSHAADRIR